MGDGIRDMARADRLHEQVVALRRRLRARTYERDTLLEAIREHEQRTRAGLGPHGSEADRVLWALTRPAS
jgi:hypothetical protein